MLRPPIAASKVENDRSRNRVDWSDAAAVAELDMAIAFGRGHPRGPMEVTVRSRSVAITPLHRVRSWSRAGRDCDARMNIVFTCPTVETERLILRPFVMPTSRRIAIHDTAEVRTSLHLPSRSTGRRWKHLALWNGQGRRATRGGRRVVAPAN